MFCIVMTGPHLKVVDKSIPVLSFSTPTDHEVVTSTYFPKYPLTVPKYPLTVCIAYIPPNAFENNYLCLLF